MALETDPNLYIIKHPKRIRLDTSNGQIGQTFQLNNAAADKFMGLSDMRSDITVAYADLGSRSQRVTKRPLLKTSRIEGSYRIEVDDQAIAENSARQYNNSGEELNTRVLNTTASVLKKGLQECLRDEKIFNKGVKSFEMASNCAFFTFTDFLAAGQLTHTALNLPDVGSASTEAWIGLEAIALINFILNGSELLWVDKEIKERQPILRTKFYEIFHPLIPVDRWARGRMYLSRHGKELLVPNSQNTVL